MNFEIQDQKIINLNSRDGTYANGQYLSSMTFPFKSILVDDPTITYTTCGVLNAQIPVSFYTINETNDNLTYSYGLDGFPTLITIPHGNYNSNSLISTLQAIFINAGHVFTIVTNKINGLMTFSADVIFSLYGSSTLFPILGFIPGETYTDTSVTGTFPLNLLGIKNIKIVSSTLFVNSYDSRNMASTACIANIPVNVPAYSLIDYTNVTLMFPILNVRVLNIIDIQILDEDNNYINFNGAHWTMTLQINTHRMNSFNTIGFGDVLSTPDNEEPDDVPAVEPLDETQDVIPTDEPTEEPVDDTQAEPVDEAQDDNELIEDQQTNGDSTFNNPVYIDPDEDELNFLES